MKIVFLAPFGIRPKGTVIARMLPLAVELQRLGSAITIVAPPYTNPEDSGRTEMLRGVKLLNVVLPQCGKALGAPVLALRMYRAALVEKPDMVHLFKPKGYGGLAAMLQLFLHRRLPLFVDTDDWEGKGGMNDLLPYSMAEKRLFAFQEEWLSRHAAGVTVASRELEKLTRETIGVSERSVLYLPNGVEEAPAGQGSRVRQKLGIPAEAPVVLLYTRFFEFSQERLHRTLAEICRRVAGVRILVVGRGSRGEDDLLLSAAKELEFIRSLTVAGWVEPGEIYDYLAAADVAIYPLDDTLTNRAKCPAKLTEIIRAGLPVVADRVGQAVEYIESGASGMLVDPALPAEMIEQTVNLLHDPQRCRVLGEAGQRRLLERFSWNDAGRKLDQFYRRTAYQ